MKPWGVRGSASDLPQNIHSDFATGRGHASFAGVRPRLLLFMEIDQHIPVLDTRLDEVQGLPPGLVLGCKRLGYDTVLGLIEWIDEPDQNGRVGLSKLRSIPHVGPMRIQRTDSSMVAIGIDLSR